MTKLTTKGIDYTVVNLEDMEKNKKSHCSTWKCNNCIKESCCNNAYLILIWTYLLGIYQYGCSKYINRWDINDQGSPSVIKKTTQKRH